MVIQDDYTETDPLANWFFSLDLKDAYFHIQIFTNLLVHSRPVGCRGCASLSGSLRPGVTSVSLDGSPWEVFTILVPLGPEVPKARLHM